MTRKRGLLIVGALCAMVLAIAAPQAARAAEYPQKGRPIVIIVPNAPGGVNDMTARLVGPILEKELGAPVQVVNKPGGATLIGLTEVALARPDGHTLLVLGLGNLTAYLDPDRNAAPQVRELQPIAAHNVDPGAVAVNAQGPYRTVKELVEASKAAPGGLKAATDGLLGSDHLATVQFMQKTGANFKLVHFDGGGPATTAVAGGHVDVRIGKVGSVYAMTKAGKVRVIGVTDKRRSKYAPEAATLEEQGWPGYTYYNYTGFAAPKGTPRAIVDAVARAVQKAVESEEAKKRLDGVALIGQFMGPEEYTALWKNMEATLEPLLREAKKR
ncbi:MAG: Bug family tripartite tricarboxylate transporter substrate binding protein [Candidatus Methylomirabilales bacterium]